MKKILLFLLGPAIITMHVMAMEQEQPHQQQVVPYQGHSAFYTMPKEIRNLIAQHLVHNFHKEGIGLHTQKRSMNCNGCQLQLSEGCHGDLELIYKQGRWPIARLLHDPNKSNQQIHATHCNVSSNKQFAAYLTVEYKAENEEIVPHSLHVVDLNKKSEIQKVDVSPFLAKNGGHWLATQVEFCINLSDNSDDLEIMEKEQTELELQGYVESDAYRAQGTRITTVTLLNSIQALTINNKGDKIGIVDQTGVMQFDVKTKTMHKTSKNLARIAARDSFNLRFNESDSTITYGLAPKIISFDANRDMLEYYFSKMGVSKTLESVYTQKQ
ncbi:MAG: hypothetical protein WCE21_01820 [Candidatus Babeliales bacterium]